MGRWVVNLQGYGQFKNGLPEDADAIAQEMLRRLLDAGHKVVEAGFYAETGISDNLLSTSGSTSERGPDDRAS